MRSWPAPTLPRLPGNGPVPRAFDTATGSSQPIEPAEPNGVDWPALAAAEIERIRGDMTALRILPPTHYIDAVEAVPVIIDMITELRERGSVYQVDYDLYFSVAGSPRFGSVSHLGHAEMVAQYADNGRDPSRAGKAGKKDPVDDVQGAVRTALLDHHHRAGWESEAGPLDEASRRLDRWRSAAGRHPAPPVAGLLDEVRQRLADDLGAPGALAAVDPWSAAARSGAGSGALSDEGTFGDDRGGGDPGGDALLHPVAVDAAAAPVTIRTITDALLGIDLEPVRPTGG